MLPDELFERAIAWSKVLPHARVWLNDDLFYRLWADAAAYTTKHYGRLPYPGDDGCLNVQTMKFCRKSRRHATN